MAKNKTKRIRLESQIQKMLHRDNGVTSHFDYHIHINSKNTVELHLLTFNPIHDDYMLLHSALGKSSIDCLEKMIGYIQQKHLAEEEKSFTISWKKLNDGQTYQSYFRGKSEEEVLQKFLHEKNPEEFEFNIRQNPIT